MYRRQTTLIVAACTAALAMLLAGCVKAPVIVSKVEAPDDLRKGVVYALPRTDVVATFTVASTKTTQAPCGKLDTAFRNVWEPLGITEAAVEKNVSNTDGEMSYAIEAVTLEGVSRPDPEAMYVIEFRQRTFENVDMAIALTETGVPTAVSVSSRHRGVELASVALSSTASLLSTLTGFHKATGGNGQGVAAYCASVADAYREVGRAKVALLSDPDTLGDGKATLEYRLSKLEAQEKALKAEFTGRKKTKVGQARFEVRIDEAATIQIGTWSKAEGLGVVKSTDVRAWLGEHTGEGGSGLPVTLHMAMLPTLRDDVATARTPKRGSAVYRIPAHAQVWLDVGTESKAIAELAIPQLGVEAAVPILDGKAAGKGVAFALHPDTGALKSVGLRAEGLPSAETLSAFGGASAEWLGAVVAASVAEGEAGPTARDRLTEQAETLELKVRIRDALEALAEDEVASDEDE